MAHQTTAAATRLGGKRWVLCEGVAADRFETLQAAMNCWGYHEHVFSWHEVRPEVGQVGVYLAGMKGIGKYNLDMR